MQAAVGVPRDSRGRTPWGQSVHVASERGDKPGTTRSRRVAPTLPPLMQCAVKRRVLSVGETPTRQLLLQPVAIGAAVEVTKRSKPLM